MSQVKLQLRGVHVFEKVANTGAFKLARVTPYLRLGTLNEVLYIQSGRVFSEEGGEIPTDKLPGWFKGEVEKASKAALRECGWPRKE